MPRYIYILKYGPDYSLLFTFSTEKRAKFAQKNIGTIYSKIEKCVINEPIKLGTEVTINFDNKLCHRSYHTKAISRFDNGVKCYIVDNYGSRLIMMFSIISYNGNYDNIIDRYFHIMERYYRYVIKNRRKGYVPWKNFVMRCLTKRGVSIMFPGLNQIQ